MQPPLPKTGAQKISTKKLISENTGETGHGADEGAVSRFHLITLLLPSRPGNTSSTLPRGQIPRGVKSFRFLLFYYQLLHGSSGF